MTLPHLGNAFVPPEKLTNYLLDEDHPKGRAKSEFFRRFGYTLAKESELAAALLNHVRENGIVKEAPSPFGMRYIAEGPIDGADGRRPNVRSVWFVEHGSTSPRLISAYPLEGDDDD